MKVRKIVITINLESAAFGDTEYEQASEVSRILRTYATRAQASDALDCVQVLKDINGNTVGKIEVSQ